MKLGILNACTPADETEFGSHEFVTFQNFFGLTNHNITFVEYRITEGEFPTSLIECNAYLITGSPKGVYDREPWIEQLSSFISNCHAAQHKMVGICFGHQILAHSLGGHAEKSEKGWGMGPQMVEVLSPQPWMTPERPHGNLYFCHQDQVTMLPTDAVRLAGNDFCPNGMFVIGKQVLGLQAHPEFTLEVMQKAINWLRPQMDTKWIDGIEAATAEQTADNEIMAQWIVNFLEGHESCKTNSNRV
ncbi:hypothetical protein KFU94_12060 [Chloroflexi bacterium TSY]|nr:hypothetical protein [Chloroflexi bacterium TSY]